MNDLIRSFLLERINNALLEGKLAKQLDHPGLSGKIKEILLNKLIFPLLNNRYSTGTGKVVDWRGTKSKEIDICIYSKNIHPPIFFSENDNLGIFPYESVLSCVEVKSVLTKRNLKDAYDRFLDLQSHLMMTPGFHDINENPLPQAELSTRYSIFFFGTQLKKCNPQSIFDMYKGIDPDWDSEPLVTSICVAGKGWLIYTHQGWLYVCYDTKNQIHEEVIGYLGSLIHDLERVENSRGAPRIGYYLTDTYKTGRFVNGKFVENPWGQGKA